MKKITLALSALLLTASAAMATVATGNSYVLVPADDATRAKGMYLTANEDGTVSYTNTLSESTLWEYTGSWNAAIFKYSQALKNGEKYLSFTEGESATLSDEVAPAYANLSTYVEGAYYLTDCELRTSKEGERTYLNAVNLKGEPANSAACALYFVEATAETTAADIETALFSMLYNDLRVIAVGGTSARQIGKYLSIDGNGKLTTSNELDLYSVWNFTQTESGNYYIQNVGLGYYLYNSDLEVDEDPVEILRAESPVVDGAYGYTSNLTATTDQSVWLNAKNTTPGVLLWTLDAGSSFFEVAYSVGMTEEDVDNKVDMYYNLPAAIAQVEGAMNGSSDGSTEVYDYLNLLYAATTPGELAENTSLALNAAISFAEDNISRNFSLYSNGQQNYINYDPDNAERPFQRESVLNTYGIWQAEFIESDDVQADSDAHLGRPFKLLNVNSGKYLGVIPFADYAPTSEADNAQIMQLTVNNSGLVVKLINEDYAWTNYLSVSNGSSDNEFLSSWSDADDSNSLFSFFDIPEFEEDEAFAELTGTTVVDPVSGPVLASINAVEIMLPVGAIVSGNGEVNFGIGTDTYLYGKPVINVEKTWTADEIKAVTPVTREVTREVYDYDIWDYVEVTDTYDVYTLEIGESYTTVGDEYVVTVDAGIFAVVTDEGLKVNPFFEASNYVEATATAAEMTITPVGGTVEELTEINLGEGDWFVNESSEGKLTLTCNGAIAKDANDLDLDCTATDIALRYLKFDAATYEADYIIPVAFTDPGEYVLTVDEGVFLNDYNNYNSAVTVTWAIEAEEAGELDGINQITSLKVNGVEIYDLSGRKVANPGTGLYIVDGQKVILK